MSPHLEAESTPALRGNYVLLRADTLRLLLPQHEVGAADYLAATLEPSDVAGLHRYAQDADTTASTDARWFAALSKDMELLPTFPSDRFVVTPLAEGDDGLAWCWNEVKILIDVELHPQTVPAVLAAPYTPVEHFVELDGEFAYLSSAERLRAYALTPRN